MTPPDGTPRNSIRKVFTDLDGLRPIWGIALFSLLPGTLFLIPKIVSHLALSDQVQQPAAPAEMVPSLVLLGEAFSFAALAFIAFLISFLEDRSFSSYGFALARALPDLSAGLAWGFVMLSALVGALAATHAIDFQGLALHGLPTLKYAAAWALAFLFVGLLEEFFFRGYLQYTLTRAFAAVLPPAAAFWVSALILSVAFFAYTHTANSGETAWGIAAVALAGTTFAFSLYRTGTLWWAIGFHTAWDWAQSFFYGTPDSGNLARGHLFATAPAGPAYLSGGTAGPEGSVLVIPVLLLTCLIIHLTLRRRIYTGGNGLLSR